MRNRDRFRGCLVGGAIGDALGYAVEFHSEDRIHSEFGPAGITRYKLRNGLALFSDDTQMTLFTATGLLYEAAKASEPRMPGGSCFLDRAYLDWYLTQTKFYPVRDEQAHASWLINVEPLFIRRAPGNTCMSALAAGAKGTIEHPVNDSKGCGGVMRVAPIGLYYIDKPDWQIEDIDMVGAQAAAITHGHELGYIPAAALVHIVYLLASGRNSDVESAVLDCLETMPKLFPKSRYMELFREIIGLAVRLAHDDMDDLSAIRKLGGGWVAEETLAIAVYCAIKYSSDFEKAIIVSVNHSGDSDSTGAVTGNILGALLGYEALPECFTRDLELCDLIVEVADDLFADCPKGSGRTDWEQKYEALSYGTKYNWKDEMGGRHG